MDLIDILKTKKIGDEVRVEGWIRNHRRQKEFGFIDFYDGTSFETLQIVYDKTNANFDEIQKMLVGCAIIVDGKLVESSGNQEYELKASNVLLVGECDETYPIQPKRHTQEFLRSVAHLRPRTRLFQAVFKIRNLAAYSIHEYFQSHNYVYVHTPLFTTSDCEGENQMFKVTTLDLENINKNEDGKVDYKADLFGKPTFITGTGQLHGEAYAMAFKKIYTFGPTFRTENSNTKTHANEFWMIEPEIAFCDLDGLMDIEEEMLKSIVSYVLKNGEEEIKFLNNFVDKNLKEKLEKLVNSNFVRITHHEAVDLLKKADIKWEFTPDYESDIAKEHEKYITEYYNAPVFITNWPKDIKAWYMKENSDGKTVAAVDLEVPGAGVDTELIDWFMDLRKYGSCYHSGFGMGFERLIIYLTGVENIRDVIPFPRTPGNCEY